MFKKYISLALIGLLLNLAFYSTATATTKKDAKFAEKVKTNIAKLGIGKDAKVEVKLKDGTKLKGYVSEVKESGFLLTSEETGMSEEILYPQVKQAQGTNSKTAKRIFVIAVLVGLIALGAWAWSDDSLD